MRLWRADFDDTTWCGVDVPSCLETRGFGSPQYTNIECGGCRPVEWLENRGKEGGRPLCELTMDGVTILKDPAQDLAAGPRPIDKYLFTAQREEWTVTFSPQASIDIDRLCPPRPETAAQFQPEANLPAVRPYRAAALKAFAYMTSLPAMTALVETGRPNQKYQHNAYVAMYKAEGRPDDLAKARALANTITCVQKPSGRIPTFGEGVNTGDSGLSDERYDWLNCMAAAAFALETLADVESVEAVAQWPVLRTYEGEFLALEGFP